MKVLKLKERRVQVSMVIARQGGVGTPGGTEAITHADYATEEPNFADSLPRSLAVIHVDKKTFWGNYICAAAGSP